MSKQSAEKVAWFLLAAQSKISKEKDDWKKELPRQREPEFEDLENSQPIYIVKKKKKTKNKKHQKACSENTKGIYNTI